MIDTKDIKPGIYFAKTGAGIKTPEIYRVTGEAPFSRVYPYDSDTELTNPSELIFLKRIDPPEVE